MKRFSDFRLCRGINKQLRYLIRKIIPGGAMHMPILAQCFGGSENFFGDHVDRATVLRQRGPQRFRATLLKLFKILSRQVKAVGMVDAEACNRARSY